jgi:hypothetical protein
VHPLRLAPSLHDNGDGGFEGTLRGVEVHPMGSVIKEKNMADIAPDGLEQFADLPGEQWEPSNGSEGCAMIEGFCSHCERDKVMNGTITDEQAQMDGGYCQILSDSFIGPVKEWREVSGEILCAAFVEQGDKVPDRCPHTLELPL